MSDFGRFTPSDLIQELKVEGEQRWSAQMVVAFDNTSILISSREKEEDALRQLKEAVELGGVPVGLIAADSVVEEGRQIVSITHRVFPGIDDVPESHKLMHRITTITEYMRQQLLKFEKGHDT